MFRYRSKINIFSTLNLPLFRIVVFLFFFFSTRSIYGITESEDVIKGNVQKLDGARLVLTTSGDKKRDGLVRPPKGVKGDGNQGDGDNLKAEDGEGAKANKSCGVFSIRKVSCSSAFSLTGR